MGQHKTNPTALAAQRGELPPKERSSISKREQDRRMYAKIYELLTRPLVDAYLREEEKYYKGDYAVSEVNHVCFAGLKTALLKFEEDGKYAECGSWSIAKGGYDLWWEIYYNGYTVLQCIDGELHSGFRPIPEFTEDVEAKLIANVREIYHMED